GKRIIDRNRATPDDGRQVVALTELHHESAILHAVDLRDVRMIQRREGSRLAFEARKAFGVRGERVRQNLDRDVALEFGVMGAVDLTHSTFAELVEDAIGPDRAADHFRYALRILIGGLRLSVRYPVVLFGSVGDC